MTSRRMQRTGWNKRLLASTRGRILALLRGDDRTINDLAAVLKLTNNAVRAHLISLERDGLVQRRGTRPGTRKPHAAYGLSAEAEHIFPKEYGPLLNHFVTAVANRVPPGALRATMREVGRAVALDHLHQVKGRGREERIEIALRVLNDLGGVATLSERDGKQVILGNGCPLTAVTASHPEACLIVETLLSKIIGGPAKKCCEYDGMPRCCFEIRR
jgi:predicted ArsR family transcriptional regulator